MKVSEFIVSKLIIALVVFTGVIVIPIISFSTNKSTDRRGADSKFVSRLSRKQECLSYINIDIKSLIKNLTDKSEGNKSCLK